MRHQFKHRETPGFDGLWCITPISNPQRYRSRYELMGDYQKRFDCSANPDVRRMVVELALGDRSHEVEELDGEKHVRLRSWDELWHKENLINVGIANLPPDWQYVAWIDGDIEFLRPDWAAEICHQLQHHMVVQCFGSVVDLGPSGETMKTYEGFVSSWMADRPRPRPSGSQAPWHPGFAWAARREAIEALGGLLDIGILGSGDHHMAWSLIGEGLKMLPPGVSKGYRRHVGAWQDRATKHIRQDIGYMPGTVVHHWHGKKRDRRYGQRWEILTKHGFDPDLDLKRDWQGVYQFTDVGERMRNDLRGYFRSRNEDSIDLECCS